MESPHHMDFEQRRALRARQGPAGRINLILRITVLVLATGVMAAGLIVAAGLVHLRSVPDEYRVVMGIVVFLYGLYRFVLTFIRIRVHGR